MKLYCPLTKDIETYGPLPVGGSHHCISHLCLESVSLTTSSSMCKTGRVASVSNDISTPTIYAIISLKATKKACISPIGSISDHSCVQYIVNSHRCIWWAGDVEYFKSGSSQLNLGSIVFISSRSKAHRGQPLSPTFINDSSPYDEQNVQC